MKETTTKLVDKKMLIALKDETWERFVQDYIVTELSANLGHRLMDILKYEKEITVRLSDMRTEESVIDFAIEYRQMMDWNPLVRCEDCAIRYTSCPMVVRSGVVGVGTFFTEDDDYCSYGVAKGESDGRFNPQK